MNTKSVINGLIISTTLLVLCLPFISVQAKTFKDVYPSMWSYYYVEDLVHQGIIDNAYYFHPERKLSRAEMVKIIVLSTTGILDDQLPEQASFPDVSPNDWFYPFVETAKITGIINGYSDGYFRPSNDVIRAEAIKIIVRGLGVEPKYTPNARFRDYDHTTWFHPFVSTAFNHQIISGVVDKNGRKQMIFNPSQAINRAEMAKITSKALRTLR